MKLFNHCRRNNFDQELDDIQQLRGDRYLKNAEVEEMYKKQIASLIHKINQLKIINTSANSGHLGNVQTNPLQKNSIRDLLLPKADESNAGGNPSKKPLSNHKTAFYLQIINKQKGAPITNELPNL